MANRDLHNHIKVTQVLTPSAKTADVNGSSVDMQGWEALEFIAVVGAEGDTLSGSVKIELEMEHSMDDSTFTDVADADALGEVTGTNTGTFAVIDIAAEANLMYKGGYIGANRYVRPVVNLTGTHTNGTVIGIVAVQSNAAHYPAGGTQVP